MKISKLFILVAIAVLISCSSTANFDQQLPYPRLHGQITYFQEKDDQYKILPINNEDIVMVGDDFFDRGEWASFYGSEKIKNRGIALEGTECTNYRIYSIASQKPAKIFLNTGLHDVKAGRGADSTAKAILNITERIRKITPKTELYVVGLLPDRRIERVEGRKDTIIKINRILEEKSKQKRYTYIEVVGSLAGTDGFISDKYSWNGINLNGSGYEQFATLLGPYIGMMHLNRANDQQYPGKSGHYLHRVSIFNSLPVSSGGKVLMLGNSLNNNVRWEEIFPNTGIINRGISGDTVEGALMRLDDVIKQKPKQIFIMLGINNFINDTTQTVISVWKSYKEIISILTYKLPDAKIYVQSTLPLNPMTKYYEGRNQRVQDLNKILFNNASEMGYEYIDLASILSNEKGDLKDKFTCDGIHLLPLAYEIWAMEVGSRIM